METTFFVFIVNLESEKLQVYKIYMKSSVNYKKTYTTYAESSSHFAKGLTKGLLILVTSSCIEG